MSEILECLDIPYGDHSLHYFDAYYELSSPNDIMICFVHGGAWVSEDKSDQRNFARSLVTSTRGIVVVPNYKLTPRDNIADEAYQHPSHCEDVLLFLNYLLTWSPRKDFFVHEPRKIYLIGHSCSSHMLSSIFLDTTSITPSLTPSRELIGSVQALIFSEGIYDIDIFISTMPRYRAAYVIPAFGDRESYAKVSAAQQMLRNGSHHIRWLIVHSKGDTDVDNGQSIIMYEHLANQYQDAGLPANRFVKKNLDQLVQQHNEIFVADYVSIVSAFILDE